LQLNSDMMPDVFVRSVNLGVKYEVTVPSYYRGKLMKSLIFKGEHI